MWYLAFEHLLDDGILVRLEVRGQRRKRGVVLRHFLGPDLGNPYASGTGLPGFGCLHFQVTLSSNLYPKS